MAKEVQKFIQEAGYQPLEDRCIIVKYAPANLSEQVTAFFKAEFYVLQMCEHEIVLLVPVFEATGIHGGVDAGTPQVAQRCLLGGQADGVRPGADGDNSVELNVFQEAPSLLLPFKNDLCRPRRFAHSGTPLWYALVRIKKLQ